MPVIWNAVIIATLLLVVPRFESEEAQLYAYAGGVLAGTVIQTVTPVWWLRGRDGRIRAVLDLRDPAVKRVLVLMLPVTLALGLINFSFVVNTFFAARFVDPQLAPSAIDAAFRVYMLPQGMFSIAVATVLFPRLSQLAARGDSAGVQADRLVGPPSDRLPPPAGERHRRGARGAHRPSALPARRVRIRPDARRCRRTCGFRARPDLQRDDAPAQPLVLQPSVALGPDRRLARRARAERDPGRHPLPGRGLGHPAGDLSRQHRRHDRAPRDPPPSPGHARRPGDRVAPTGALRSRPPRRAQPPSGPGTGWTSSWAGRSARRSSRWAAGILVAAGVFLAVSALLRVRELQTILSLVRRSGTTTDDRP